METQEVIKAIKNGQARIIDVRTPTEYMGGHVVNSENIPLNKIPDKINELLHENRPLVFCCASGNRSGQAIAFLKANGVVNAINGGSWLDVNSLI